MRFFLTKWQQETLEKRARALGFDTGFTAGYRAAIRESNEMLLEAASEMKRRGVKCLEKAMEANPHSREPGE
jgi:hypothetical protein